MKIDLPKELGRTYLVVGLDNRIPAKKGMGVVKHETIWVDMEQPPAPPAKHIVDWLRMYPQSRFHLGFRTEEKKKAFAKKFAKASVTFVVKALALSR